MSEWVSESVCEWVNVLVGECVGESERVSAWVRE